MSAFDQFDRPESADDLFVELSRIDRAPDALTDRVLGEIGYRPITGSERSRRARRRLITRLGAAAGLAASLVVTAVLLRADRGIQVDDLTVAAAVAGDVGMARERVADLVSALGTLVPARPVLASGSGDASGTDVSLVADLPDVESVPIVGPADAALVAPAHRGPGFHFADLAPQPPLPVVGPSRFPSAGGAGRGLHVPLLPPAGSRLTPEVEWAGLGPLTLAEPRLELRSGHEPGCLA